MFTGVLAGILFLVLVYLAIQIRTYKPVREFSDSLDGGYEILCLFSFAAYALVGYATLVVECSNFGWFLLCWVGVLLGIVLVIMACILVIAALGFIVTAGVDLLGQAAPGFNKSIDRNFNEVVYRQGPSYKWVPFYLLATAGVLGLFGYVGSFKDPRCEAVPVEDSPTEDIRAVLEEHAPELVEDFDELIQ